MPLAVLDHLVVGASSLEQGVEWVRSVTGATAMPGGKHLAMGTHNALLKLGERLFLEIMAIDPDGIKPSRPRWFGLDDRVLQSELSEQPRLIHWVARCDDIGKAVAACPIELGPVTPIARGDFRWRITIPDNGALPVRGIFPTLMQWDVPFHPADRLPPSSVSLMQLGATCSEPAPIRAALAVLGLSEALPVTFDRETRLAAMLRTPQGHTALTSP